MFHLFILAFLFGIGTIQWLALPPAPLWVFSGALASLIAYIKWRHTLPLLILAGFLGMGWIGLHVSLLLNQCPPQSLEGKPVQVRVKVVDLPDIRARKAQFTGQILAWKTLEGEWKNTKLGKSKVSWINSSKKIFPGDEWQFTLKLKRPRGYANPGSFDARKYYFENRITSKALVVPKSNKTLIKRNPNQAPINTARLLIKQFIEKNLKSDLVGPILAMTIGDKGQISPKQWEVFQRTGTAHLMAISGLHIGLVASLCFSTLR